MNNKTILQLEAAALFCLSLFAYHTGGYSWWMFATYFLIPDAALIGYSISNKFWRFSIQSFTYKNYGGPFICFWIISPYP